MGLFDFLTRDRHDPDLADTLQDVVRRVGELEALQLTRELEWRETRDKLLRYLKRVQEVDRRESKGQFPGRGSSAALMAAKFGRRDHNGEG